MKLKDHVALNPCPTTPAPRRVDRLLRHGPQAHARRQRSSLQLRPANAARVGSIHQRRSQRLATPRQRPDGTSAKLKSP